MSIIKIIILTIKFSLSEVICQIHKYIDKHKTSQRTMIKVQIPYVVDK